jgi:hypothetical protein
MDRGMLSRVMYLTSTHDLTKEDGRCHVCAEKKTLTREHVPPRSAFNGSDALWERLVIPCGAAESARRVHFRGGFWVKTLCKDCNERHGSKYANAYVQFVRHLLESPKLFDASASARLVRVPFDTLMLAKEIATMILAIEPVTYGDHCPGLRRFVLDETLTFLPNFRILSFLVPDVPQAGTITRFHARAATFARGYGFIGGEISMFPFGFVYAAEIGQGYLLNGLTDVTRWFSTDNMKSRLEDVVSLHCRITGVDSIQCGVGRRRVRPQIDYVYSGARGATPKR